MLGQKPPFRYADPTLFGGPGRPKRSFDPARLARNDDQRHSGQLAGRARRTHHRPIWCWELTRHRRQRRFSLGVGRCQLVSVHSGQRPNSNGKRTTGRWLWQGIRSKCSSARKISMHGGAIQFGDRQVSSARAKAPMATVGISTIRQSSRRENGSREQRGQRRLYDRSRHSVRGPGLQPRENQELLFDIGVNDNTAGRRQFMWNGVARNSGDRGAWGRAKLVK